MSSTDRLDVAIVGAGLMGRWHAHYARRSGARIVAVVDASREAAQALARRAGHVPAFADLGATLQAARPQVVHICTPSPTHLALALEAIDAGSHVLVEKPLTPAAGETESLLQKAREKGVHACPVHQFAFQDGVARSAGALAELGEPLDARFTICSAGGGERAGAALDAVVAEILPHPFAVIQALWPGHPMRVEDWTARSSAPGELAVHGSFAAVPVSVRISMGALPTRCEMEVLCRDGSIHLDFFHGYAVVRRGRASRANKVGGPFLFAAQTAAIAAANLARRALRGEPAYPGLGPLIARFYSAARGAAPNPLADADTVAAARVREHVIRLAIASALR